MNVTQRIIDWLLTNPSHALDVAVVGTGLFVAVFGGFLLHAVGKHLADTQINKEDE